MCGNGKLAKTKDFVNSKKNQKYNDTKDYSLLLVWAKSIARTSTEVHCFLEEVFARL